MEPIATICDLRKFYGMHAALDGISLELPRGRILGLLGPNGSGKTTLLKILAGLLQPDSGYVRIQGENVSHRTKAWVSYLPDRTYLNNRETVEEQLDFFQTFYGDFDRSRAEAMLADLSVTPDQRLGALSKGNREKVQLVLVMARRAKLYLLDEPIGGVDPAARDYILDTVVRNRDPESTVLISTHLIADVEPILDGYIFLHKGQVLASGDVRQNREETGRTLDEQFREVFRCF